MSYNEIPWLALCVALTVAGGAGTWLAFRRRGFGAGLRAAAWTLLPLAAYLTGALETVWEMGTSVVSFATGLVFSPKVWIGVALAGVSAVLFLVSGGVRGRLLSRARKQEGGKPAQKTTPLPVQKKAAQKTASTAAETPAVKAAPQKPADDFSDIEDILRRRGIS